MTRRLKADATEDVTVGAGQCSLTISVIRRFSLRGYAPRLTRS